MKPIFIAGAGRSGTTVLKDVLRYHSKIIALPVELRVLIDPDGALHLISAMSERWSPYNADVALKRFCKLMLECGRTKYKVTNLLEKIEKKIFWSVGTTTRRYLGMGFQQFFGTFYYQERLAQLMDELKHHTSFGCHDASPPYHNRSTILEASPLARIEVGRIMAHFFNDLYKNASANQEKTHWVDDTPYNLLHAHELLEVFPEMQLIHIYRDPRDIVASCKVFRWGGDSYAAIAKRIGDVYTRWFEIRRRLPSTCFTEVSLEKLARSQEAELSAIYKFIGLDFEKGSNRISIKEVHPGRWQRDIPKHDWQLVKNNLKGCLDKYGNDARLTSSFIYT